MSGFDETGDGPGEGHRCNTCKAIFSSVNKVKEHYRGDWHIFNSKRRAHEMDPISKADFKAANLSKKGASLPLPKQGTFGPELSIAKTQASTPQPQSGHASLASKKSAEKEAAPSSSAKRNGPKARVETVFSGDVYTWGGITTSSVEELRSTALTMGVGAERVESIVKLALERQQKEQTRNATRREAFLRISGIDDEDTEASEKLKSGGDDAGEEMEEVTALLGSTISIFDDKEFETTEECLAYMESEFGFFIPDRDCLDDLEGILEYLGEKVKLGGFCLYCQKQFRAGKPCQAHMVDKSHCKIAYEEEVDMDEFEDFYDFTQENENLPVDADGNPIEGAPQVLHTGELLMPSGKILGHKAYRMYYKTYYAPEDNRPSVIAAQREELIKLGWQVGENYTDDDVVAMPDIQVMSLLVAHKKARRRELMFQQRAQQKDLMRANRTDHVVKSSKLKSSEQKTQIIRDYHGRLQ